MNLLPRQQEFLEAVNDYSDFSPKQKMIFNTLLKVAINNKVKVTINYIHEQTKITRATISSTLAFLNERGFIMVEKQKGNRFTGCDIVPSKLNEILMHYQIKNN